MDIKKAAYMPLFLYVNFFIRPNKTDRSLGRLFFYFYRVTEHLHTGLVSKHHAAIPAHFAFNSNTVETDLREF
jgi:hypothetical protein